jgi:hypothetical protein
LPLKLDSIFEKIKFEALQRILFGAEREIPTSSKHTRALDIFEKANIDFQSTSKEVDKKIVSGAHGGKKARKVNLLFGQQEERLYNTALTGHANK